MVRLERDREKRSDAFRRFLGLVVRIGEGERKVDDIWREKREGGLRWLHVGGSNVFRGSANYGGPAVRAM